MAGNKDELGDKGHIIVWCFYGRELIFNNIETKYHWIIFNLYAMPRFLC